MMTLGLPLTSTVGTAEEELVKLKEQIIELENEKVQLQSDLERTCRMLEVNEDREADGLESIRVSLGELQTSDATNLITLTRETHKVSGRMSANLRKRDLERARLEKVMKLLRDLEVFDKDLRALEAVEFKDGNLPEECHLFHKVYHLSNQMVAPWACRYMKESGALFEKLESLKKVLVQRLTERIPTEIATELTVNPDTTMGLAFETLELFIVIGESKVGLTQVSSLLQKFAAQALSGIIPSVISPLEFCFAAKVSRVTDFVKGLTEWCWQRLLKVNGLDEMRNAAHSTITEGVFSEAQSSIITLIRNFFTERKIRPIIESLSMDQEGSSSGGGGSSSGGGGENGHNIRDLDLLVAEIALIIPNCMAFSREQTIVAKRLSSSPSESLTAHLLPNLGRLYEFIAELLECYLQIERAYLTFGIRMALSMNEIPVEEKTSTCIEDVFFLVKKATMRAITVGETGIIRDMIEATRNSFVVEMIPAIQKRLSQLFPDCKTSGGDSIVVAINDASAARHFLGRLVDELHRVIEGGTFLYSIDKIRTLGGEGEGQTFSLDRSKLNSTMNDLDLLANAFETIIRKGLETIYSTQIKNKLSLILLQVSKELSGGGGEVTEFSLLRIVSLLEQSLSMPPLDRLVEENRILLLLLVTREVCTHLERAILSTRWTGPRLVAFDREIRRLSAYLADLTELQAKELFLKVFQFLSILDNESREEAITFANESRMIESWKLADQDVKAVLACRVDWSC